MNKIDKYILKKFLTTFFFTVILITLVSIVIDFSDRADKFISQEIPLKEILFDYYLNFVPWINGLLWPLFSLIAVIFFTSRLAKNTEIVAILSAGVSYRRFLRPYLFGSFVIGGLLWMGSNFIIPKSNKTKTAFEQKYIYKHKVKSRGNDIHLFVAPGEKIYLRYFRKVDTTGTAFRFERFENGELRYVLKASKIALKEPPNLWTLTDFEKRSFKGLNETLLLAKGGTMDTTLNLMPGDFISNSMDMYTMTTPQLRKVVKRNEERGLGASSKYQIEIHKRSSDPATVIILTLIGVSVASRKSRGGMGLNLAIGIVAGAIFVVLSRFSETFIHNLNFPASIGVWIPNLLFGLIAVYLLSKAQK